MVPYRGEASALPDILGGQVPVLFGTVQLTIEYIRSGRLRALGVTSATRSEALPDILVDNLLGELHGHGMGRHTTDEIETVGKADLIALSDFLGDKPYLLGGEPTSYDATAYSFVAHMIQPDYDSRMKRFIKTLPSVMQYWDRLTSKLYKS
jgi:hypothetical protein